MIPTVADAYRPISPRQTHDADTRGSVSISNMNRAKEPFAASEAPPVLPGVT